MHGPKSHEFIGSCVQIVFVEFWNKCPQSTWYVVLAVLKTIFNSLIGSRLTFFLGTRRVWPDSGPDPGDPPGSRVFV